MATAQEEMMPAAIAVKRNSHPLCIRLCVDSRLRLPSRSMANPSPVKPSASNNTPSQSQNCDAIDEALKYELNKARLVSTDLADQMFGELITTSLVRQILHRFLKDGIVRVSMKGKRAKSTLDDEGMSLALQAAYDNALARGCHRLDAPQGDLKATEKASNRYSWEWSHFPSKSGNTLKENDLVEFLNGICDKSLSVAMEMGCSLPPARNRFACPTAKHRAIPLAYEPDREDMRPDFMVLPIAAFKGDQFQVDQTYVNFTCMLVVGEVKTSDSTEGVAQVQRYMRGIKRAQPWVRYAVGMVMTPQVAILVRGDGSGAERIEMLLNRGRGCLDFIRVLLGIVIADREVFGHNPLVELGEKDVECDISLSRFGNLMLSENIAPASVPKFMDEAARNSSAASGRNIVPHIYATRSATRDSNTSEFTSSISSLSKRSYSQISSDDEARSQTKRPRKKSKVQQEGKKLKVHAFVPVKAYGRECIGIMFTSGSIRGRGTTVYVIIDAGGGSRFTALKTSWQDVARVENQKTILKKLNSCNDRRHVAVPSEYFISQWRDNKDDSTLGSIRAFVQSGIDRFPIENRVLMVTLSELRRPVKYFWSVHDFVRGIKGALAGHEYLCQIGILHRDISENNIVLPTLPGTEEGALIDFDMAIEIPPTTDLGSSRQVPERESPPAYPDSLGDPPHPQDADNLEFVTGQQYKAERTGTTPYMSINVLQGNTHTPFDDIESFLYVLVLFFFSYAGPLARSNLHDAHNTGFAHQFGSGRLPHVRVWPQTFLRWTTGESGFDFMDMADRKMGILRGEHAASRFINRIHGDLAARWLSKQLPSINTLIRDCWKLFANEDYPVGHRSFIPVLELWLEKYASEEAEYSQCPHL